MKETGYDKVARFYDKVIGEQNDSVDYVKEKIVKYNNSAEEILELGCGTGNNLFRLRKDFRITGIDLSDEMIKIARRKIPGHDFYLQDIRDFRLDKTFDVILCLYDTINHLTLFNDWKKVFKNVYSHLSENGLFIFDINTLYKLNLISRISPFINEFGRDYLLVNVKKISLNTFNWNLKIFEHKSKDNFVFYETNIKESSFEITRIRQALEKYFVVKNVEEENSKRVGKKTERAYFVGQRCQ